MASPAPAVGARPRIADDERDLVGPAAATGRALKNLAPKSRAIGKCYLGNHREYRFLTPDWPAP
jgi:hypothetical protein